MFVVVYANSEKKITFLLVHLYCYCSPLSVNIFCDRYYYDGTKTKNKIILGTGNPK